MQRARCWGATWQSAWFKLIAEVPSGWAGEEVFLWLDIDSEGLVFDSSGRPLSGITNGSVMTPNRYSRDLVSWLPKAKGGEPVEAWLEGACNGIMGLWPSREECERTDDSRFSSHTGTVKKLRMAILDPECIALWHDMTMLLDLMQVLPAETLRRVRILKALGQAIDAFGDGHKHVALAREILKPLMESPANASALSICGVGHAHIDTAWLWPVRESIRKAARTFSSQLRLIERYPDYVFGASQPQHYQFVKDHYPELYEEIRQAVASGSWELQGAMWVEADCNLISGESMVRQFVHGKNFFMDEFGVDVKNLWIPDVFGYSASMPQIMKRAGVDYFLTQKISWNQFNRFPYTTFRWRGIDGTEILTHFPPEDTYNSDVLPGGMVKIEHNFKEKDVLGEAMCLFGMGDGGGGPREDALERGRRMASLEGAPKFRFGRADEYFERIAPHTAELPLWQGELYLELHRGTLTTQSRTKRNNRMLEIRLRLVEYVWSLLPAGDYPRAELDRLWKILLINQFHDIIPGSSIHCVYQTTEAEHAEALAACDSLIGDAEQRLCKSNDDVITLVNTTAYPYARPVKLPADWKGAKPVPGEPLPVQCEQDGSYVLVHLEPQDVAVLERCDVEMQSLESSLVLENDLVRYEFNEQGRLISGFDKACNREILAGEGNVLTIYEDRPANWDAWDIDFYYQDQVLEHPESSGVEFGVKGIVRQSLAFSYVTGNSTMRQRVVLATDSKRLDFETEVDWHEKHRMLRVAFPVNVVTDKATFDIQYGSVERPTHTNTSWDAARFEVCAHKYADLSDQRWGVALMNDCKYGMKVRGNVLDLNLLRSPTSPDPDADQGRHGFTYSLLPHDGRVQESDVRSQSTQLNVPPVRFDGRFQSLELPVTLESETVEIGSLKRGEKDDCRILRLAETAGMGDAVKLQLADGLHLVETNLLEWTEEGERGSGSVSLDFKPFEIRTFKLVESKELS